MVDDHFSCSEAIKLMPIWIRLSSFSREWMNSDLLCHIGGTSWMMCKVDSINENQTGGRYACICVEIYIYKPLVEFLNEEDMSIKVKCENLGLICFSCGRYGHSKESCKKQMVRVQEEMQNVEVEARQVTMDTSG
ncbi:hypothetical protein ACOSQ4_021771 [Xanthoceras sorbifolium]